MTDRIQEAIDIFLDALNNKTLAKGTCVACAVGNLVAHGIGGKIKRDLTCDKPNNSWGYLFFTDSLSRKQIVPDLVAAYTHVEAKERKNSGRLNVEATRFSLSELMKIEHAFETNTSITHMYYSSHTDEEIRADQIRGLTAVVNVMLEFDEQPETAEQTFLVAANLIPV